MNNSTKKDEVKLKIKKILFGVMTLTLTLGIGSYFSINAQNSEKSSNEEDNNLQFEDSVTYVNFDYTAYDSPESLFESSSSVITGKVLSYKDEHLNIVMTEEEINQLEGLTMQQKKELINSSKNPEYFPYRIFDVQVTENYKGKHKIGDVIKVKQLYGKLDNQIYDNDELLLELGNEYMLFLMDYPSSPSSLLNQEQSSYLVDKNSSDENILIPVNKKNKDIKINKQKAKHMGKKYK